MRASCRAILMARLTAQVTAISDAETMLGSLMPYRCLPSTSVSTNAIAVASEPPPTECSE